MDAYGRACAAIRCSSLPSPIALQAHSAYEILPTLIRPVRKACLNPSWRHGMLHRDRTRLAELLRSCAVSRPLNG
ncbi:hypothetical protein ADT25_20005 [Xanthomonas oryzae]|uniref:Uncharacterized protein n=1 Tax=Xanthomonas oryzae TaxID=347 RepID=A0AAP0ZHY1_9XANT|nr:hypothetical protein ADT25_20005 [Xanthomonas oryzae]QBG83965.1 hypothetical protein EYR27_08755 [Xanthomonas oryzae]